MGIPAINSLANMEYMLYGGASNLNGNCPSYSNGYMANYTNYNPAYGYGGYPEGWDELYAYIWVAYYTNYEWPGIKLKKNTVAGLANAAVLNILR